jgi:LPXTG-site transpeptidase (sortase) family protein
VIGTNSQTGNATQTNRGETPVGAVPLPPVRLQIPALELDVPMLLTDNDNLPREQYAGWLFKSAFPATVGNMVILGHLDGAAAIFGRLNELQSGDEIRVYTKRQIHVYIVEESLTVADTAVEVLAPTDRPMVTLITCAGDWNPYERSYDQRLVVRANYSAVEDLPS